MPVCFSLPSPKGPKARQGKLRALHAQVPCEAVNTEIIEGLGLLGFMEIRGPFLPVIRIIVYWALKWGPLFMETTIFGLSNL